VGENSEGERNLSPPHVPQSKPFTAFFSFFSVPLSVPGTGGKKKKDRKSGGKGKAEK